MNPTEGAFGVPLNSVIELQFSESVDVSTLTPNRCRVFRGANQLAGSIEIQSPNSARLVPANVFPNHTEIRVEVLKTVRSTDGRPLDKDYVWSFRTQDMQAPMVVESFPLDGMKLVPIDAAFHVSFSEPIDPASIHAGNVLLRSGAPGLDCPDEGDLPGNIEFLGQGLRFLPANPLLPSQTNGLTESYTWTLGPGIRDLGGNPLTPICFRFSTQDLFGPELSSTIPSDGQAEVELSASTVEAHFSEVLRPETVSAVSFLLEDEFGRVVPSPPQCEMPFDTVRLAVPAEAPFFGLFFPGTQYQVHMSTAIQDHYANPLPAELSWSFRTRSGWHPPLEIENKIQDAKDAQLKYDELRGVFHAVWLQKRPNMETYGVFAGVFDRDVPDPLVAFEVSGDVTNCESPTLAIAPDGAVHYIWEQQLSGVVPSILTRMRSPEGTLDNAEAIDVDGEGSASNATDPRIAVHSNGDVQVVFAQQGSFARNLYATRKLQQGNWESPIVIDADGELTNRGVSLHQMELDSVGTVYAVFSQKLPGAGSVRNGIYVARRSPAGAWETPLLIDNYPVNLPALTLEASVPQIDIASDDTVYVSFLQKTNVGGTGSSVFVNRRTPGAGGTWIAPGLVPVLDNDQLNSAQGCSNPVIACAPDGSVHCVFIQNLVGTTGSVVANRLPPGGNWQIPPVEIDGSVDQAASNPLLVVGSQSKAVVVFQRWAAGVYSLYGTQLPSGAVWEAPTRLDMMSSTASNAAMGVDTLTGTARVIWKQPVPPETLITNLYSSFYR